MSKRIGIVITCIMLGMFTLTACEGDTPQTMQTNPQTAASQYCDQNHSLACKMVIWRYGKFTNPDQYGYFYGMVQGVDHPVVMYVVQGAVFPVDDMTTPPDYVQSCGSTCGVVRQAQQPDGTWGTNGLAMFGRLADGQYFEWLGPYAFSFQPLPFLNVKVVGCPVDKHIPGC